MEKFVFFNLDHWLIVLVNGIHKPHSWKWNTELTVNMVYPAQVTIWPKQLKVTDIHTCE